MSPTNDTPNATDPEPGDAPSVGLIPGLQAIAGPVWELLRELGVRSGQMITLWSEGVALTGVSDPATYASPDVHAHWVAPIPPPDGSQTVALHRFGDADPTWYDLVLTALPLADFRLPDPDLRDDLTDLHAETLAHALRRVTAGGVLVAIASHQVLDDPAEHDKRALAALGDLVGAARLPDNALHPEGTYRVGDIPSSGLAPSDLLVFRRRPAGAPDRSAPFVMARRRAVQGGSVMVSEYYKHYPHHMIGAPGLKTVNGQSLLTVHPDPVIPLADALRAVLADVAHRANERDDTGPGERRGAFARQSSRTQPSRSQSRTRTGPPDHRPPPGFPSVPDL